MLKWFMEIDCLKSWQIKLKLQVSNGKIAIWFNPKDKAGFLTSDSNCIKDEVVNTSRVSFLLEL